RSLIAEKAVRGADATLAAEVLIPILLIAGADGTRRDGFSESVTVGLLDSAEALVDRGHFRSSFPYELGENDDDPWSARDEAQNLALGDLLVQALEDLAIPAAKRRRYLDTGATLAADAVGRIVGNQDRRRYLQAAALAVAHAEAIAIANGRAAGDAAAEAAQVCYPRHTAYRSELMSARARSPFLTSPGRFR
ncbi:MAG: hypothetical protein ACRDLR_07015, partial [Gaiellaceae bacterium]